jgi:hypothetical protein
MQKKHEKDLIITTTFLSAEAQQAELLKDINPGLYIVRIGDRLTEGAARIIVKK